MSVGATNGEYPSMSSSVDRCLSRCSAALTRRILLFPFGNSNAPPNDTVSVYLDYADPKRAPEGWHACAQFALVISNPNDPTIYTVSREHDRKIYSTAMSLNYVMTRRPPSFHC